MPCLWCIAAEYCFLDVDVDVDVEEIDNVSSILHIIYKSNRLQRIGNTIVVHSS